MCGESRNVGEEKKPGPFAVRQLMAEGGKVCRPLLTGRHGQDPKAGEIEPGLMKVLLPSLMVGDQFSGE